MSHLHGEKVCEHGTKAACEKARKEFFGKCSSMTADKKVPTECRLWATSFVDGKGQCAMHAGQILTRQLDETRAAAKKAELDARIEHYIAWSATFPSIWDEMPAFVPKILTAGGV